MTIAVVRICVWWRRAADEGGVEAFIERTRRKSNMVNWLDQTTEHAVVKLATDFPVNGQVRTSNELRKQGVLVSPSGVQSI